MLAPLIVLFHGLLVVAAADLFTGSIHWLEDTFWSEETPVIGKWLIQPNELHHKKPTAFLEKNWWQSSWDALLVGLCIIVIAFLINRLRWEVWLFVIVSSCANQIHKYSHQPKSRLPPIIRFLQKIKVLQDSRHHVKHHLGDKDSHYCLITTFVNPILDKTHFWKALEKILEPFLEKRGQDRPK